MRSGEICIDIRRCMEVLVFSLPSTVSHTFFCVIWGEYRGSGGEKMFLFSLTAISKTFNEKRKRSL